ncbi:MAG: family efflux transporter subunit, partial [Segetibacter sp.]|nr:family efflux transporter subunit [Segetibacter sp.]
MLHITKTNLFHSVAVFTFCLFISGAITSCNSSEQKQEAEKEQQKDSLPAAIEVVTAQKGKLASSLQIPGELIPYQQVDIYAKENSFVKKVFVDVGSEVKQGQLLVSMEAPEINSRMSEAQSTLKSLQALYISS